MNAIVSRGGQVNRLTKGYVISRWLHARRYTRDFLVTRLLSLDLSLDRVSDRYVAILPWNPIGTNTSAFPNISGITGETKGGSMPRIWRRGSTGCCWKVAGIFIQLRNVWRKRDKFWNENAKKIKFFYAHTGEMRWMERRDFYLGSLKRIG